MSGEEEDSDKQYAPSQKKLEDARKKGEIARSTDLTTAGAYAGFLFVMLTIGSAALQQLGATLAIMLAQSQDLSDLMFSGSGRALHAGMLRQIFWDVVPWFAVSAVVAILAVALQRGFLFTPSKLLPKLNRISPISGVKNKFGRQGLFEFAKSSTKLVIYTVVLGFFLAGQIERIIGSMQLQPALITVEMGRMLVALMGIVLIIALVIGVIDYLWQLAEHTRKNRMSRKELMDEQKQAEGDPYIKQQRRQRGQELAANQMLADVPTADVVIVNPTHYAVALQWDHSRAGAPVCVAKGVDVIAARIRDCAEEHAIPVHADPPTARALFAEVGIGQEISQEHYRAVAAAIRFAESIRANAGRS